MLKSPVIPTESGNAGDRVFFEARRMWSHLLIPAPRKTFPNIATSLDYGPERHEPILWCDHAMVWRALPTRLPGLALAVALRQSVSLS